MTAPKRTDARKPSFDDLWGGMTPEELVKERRPSNVAQAVANTLYLIADSEDSAKVVYRGNHTHIIFDYCGERYDLSLSRLDEATLNRRQSQRKALHDLRSYQTAKDTRRTSPSAEGFSFTLHYTTTTAKTSLRGSYASIGVSMRYVLTLAATVIYS